MSKNETRAFDADKAFDQFIVEEKNFIEKCVVPTLLQVLETTPGQQTAKVITRAPKLPAI